MANKLKILLKKTMNWLMLSCEKATFYVVKSRFKPLTAKEKAQLKMHLAACKDCSTFEKQSKMIDEQLDKLEKELPKKLSDTKKAELEEIIAKETGEDA